MKFVNLVNRPYIELKNSRYQDWFNSFLLHTNEKIQSAEILKSVVNVLLENRSSCVFVDIGAGEGTLAKNIVEVLQANCNNISYNGIEVIETYATKANKTLQSLNISLANIQQGNFLEKSDLLRMPGDADIILASHVAYYAKNVTEFVLNLTPLVKDDTKLIFVHQSIYSKAIELRDTYRLEDVLASPQVALREALEAQNFEVKELYYPASIIFPNDVAIADVINDVLARKILSPQAQIVRNLMEFILHVPLEYLRNRNKLEYFGEMLASLLEGQKNHFIIWDVFQIATKQALGGIKNSSTQINLKDFAHINNFWATFSPIEIACFIGNLGIVKQLKLQVSKEIPFRGLNFASSNGHIEIVEELLEIKEQFDLNIKSEHGRTALHLSAYYDHPYVVALLLSAGVNMQAEDDDGKTALDLSARNCNIGATEILWNYTNFTELGDRRTFSLCSVLHQECARKAPIKVSHLENRLYLIVSDCYQRLKENSENFNKQDSAYYYEEEGQVELESINAIGKNAQQHQDEL
jgi:hypothetical protein